MLKKGEGDWEYEIKDGEASIFRETGDIELEQRNVESSHVVIEAELKKTYPIQPFWTIHARAAVRLPCNANIHDIAAAFKVAWEIVDHESEKGLEKGQQRLVQHIQARGSIQTQQPQQTDEKPAAANPDDIFTGWEIE